MKFEDMLKWSEFMTCNDSELAVIGEDEYNRVIAFYLSQKKDKYELRCNSAEYPEIGETSEFYNTKEEAKIIAQNKFNNFKKSQETKMIKIYYTAKEGRRNTYGHTITKGNVYKVENNELSCLGEYKHQSGGAGIEHSILTVCAQAGINTKGGYYGSWREVIELENIA